jgi:6-phosphogluconolactonase (cycloisomerase 2 family)
VAVSPNGLNVYVTGNSEDGIATFNRNPDGSLDYVSRIEDGDVGIDGLDGAWAVTVAPDGKNVYVTADVDDAITTFQRDTTTGVLTWKETVKDGPGSDGLDGATGVAVSPDNNDVYVTGCFDSAVTVFDRTGASGELTVNEKEQQGVAGVDGIGCARGVAVAPNGSTVSVVGESSDAVATFTRTPATGAIAYLGMVKDGVGGVDGLDGARDVAYTADSAGLYVASLVDDSVASFTANPGTGVLAFVESDRDGVGGVQGLDGANGIAVPVDGKHVYVTGENDDAVATFVRTLADPQPPAAAAAERHVTFTVKKKTVVKGKKAKFKGALVSSTPACKASQVVQISKSTKGRAFKPAGTATTAPDGSFKVAFKVRKKTRFRASVVATSACIAAQSPPRTVKVT